MVGHDWGAAVAWRMAGQEPERLLSAAMLQAPDPAVCAPSHAEDRDQRQKSRYVQILRLPWLSEMALKLGDYAALARAFKSSTRPEAFSPEILETYRGAWRQPGAITSMLNWYRALFLYDPPMPAPGSLTPRILALWGDRDDFAFRSLSTRASRSALTRALSIGLRLRTGSSTTSQRPCRTRSSTLCSERDQA